MSVVGEGSGLSGEERDQELILYSLVEIYNIRVTRRYSPTVSFSTFQVSDCISSDEKYDPDFQCRSLKRQSHTT